MTSSPFGVGTALAPQELLELLTAAFLYVFAAGGYALFLTLYRLFPHRGYLLGCGSALGLLLGSAGVLVGSGAFSPFWKGLVSFMTLLYLALPFLVGWIAARIHRERRGSGWAGRGGHGRPSLPGHR